MVFQNFNTKSSNEEIDYSSFLDLVNQNQVRSVEVEGLTIKANTKTDEGLKLFSHKLSTKLSLATC